MSEAFDLHFGFDYVRVLEAGGTTDDVVAKVYGKDEQQTKARALLFFAAPDLLEVARLAANVSGKRTAEKLKLAALAALAKATGS